MKMKRFTPLLLTVLAFITQYANAKIRRVGYWGLPITGQDYADLASAHNAASPGDTLLIFAGNYSAAFSKKLIVIGYGYF